MEINNPAIAPEIRSLTAAEFISGLLKVIIGVAFIVGSVIFVFMLLFGAVEWISSGGDKAKVEAARDRILHALIGLVLLFSVFAAAILINNIFGINILVFNPSIINIALP